MNPAVPRRRGAPFVGSLLCVSLSLCVLAARPAATDAAESPDDLLREVKVPAGFVANIFAGPPQVNYPTFVTATADGTLYVSSDLNGSLGRDPHHGRVLRLRDLDGDGRADEIKTFVADVDSPRGLAWDVDRLYLMHPPHLSAFIDHDGDGVADEEKVLVKNIAFDLKQRPADHTSNGVTLGIDGWLYLAIGDFGFLQAEGSDGRQLQLRGGGVARVRPDGSGLEIFSRGTRNIYGVAVDPLLNAFARDNTNDGGGWDIRLHHFTGLEHHGYPSLFTNFGDEIVQPLADYGGGSGVGGIYLSEPGFPGQFGTGLYTCDWGRGWVYRHALQPKGATFSAQQAEFIAVPRVTDMTVDGSSRLYVASWKGGMFNYAGENVGYIARVVPQDYRPAPLIDFARASDADLARQLASPSHQGRLAAQRQLLHRLSNPGVTPEIARQIEAMAADRQQPLEVRVAALFTLQLARQPRTAELLKQLVAEPALREHALRAWAESTAGPTDVPAEPFVKALADENPRVRLQGIVGLARLCRPEQAAALTALLTDPDPVVAHTAVAALVSLRGSEACFAVIDRPDASFQQRRAALRVLHSLHDAAVVAGLEARLDKPSGGALRRDLLTALCRLYFQEGSWKGTSWGTRPDTSGPYFQAETWSESPRIAARLKAALAAARGEDASRLAADLNRHKIQLDGTLDLVLDAAQRDSATIPAAVGILSRSSSIPERAVPLLVAAAEDPATAPAVRSQAVTALAQCPDRRACQAMLAALVQLDQLGRGQRDFQQARTSFLNTKSLGDHHDWLESTAATDGAAAVWADAALLTLSTRNQAAPEARQAATSALDAGWREPQRRARILRAVAAAQYRPYADKVLESLADVDKQVAAAAKQAAGELRLSKTAKPRPTGPKIGTQPATDVVAAVLVQPGDAALGEELFVKLSCVKCHTVKAGEPPRGPFLGSIAATYKRRELAEAVLLPSKTIAQGFATNQFVLDDGRSLTGFVVLEGADEVVIRDLDGKETRIPAKEIEQRVVKPMSMMPEGLVKEITLGEFAALITYLESLVKK